MNQLHDEIGHFRQYLSTALGDLGYDPHRWGRGRFGQLDGG